MKPWILAGLSLTLLILFLAPQVNFAQGGNIDWEILWEIRQPTSTNAPYGWMAGQRQYTGLAYDKWRDVLYIVNPALCNFGGSTFPCPTIHVWDAMTGVPSTTVGRNQNTGAPGKLSVPIDTVVAFPPGWPGAFGSFSQGQFPIYKIDLDDEGRIFTGNLVSPIWGICFPGPPPNCDPIYLLQGPFRVYRWDTPSSAPRRVYATLTGAQNQTGTLTAPWQIGSTMPWTRWGDAFEVRGLQNWVKTGPNDSVWVDSTRIFVSGGTFSGQSETNRMIGVLLSDTRQNRVSNGMGQALEYRMGVRLWSSLEGIASHGIAATGALSISELWMDNNNRVTTLNNQGQTSAPFPQDITMTRNHALSSDPINGTGRSGAIAFFQAPFTGATYLICADGYPTNPGNPTLPNNNTRARIMNITTTGQETREPFFGDTPFLGNRILSPNSGIDNYISDVDFKLMPDPTSGHPHVILFVLMSNNGIAAYRSRRPIATPVAMTVFRAIANKTAVDLTWQVIHESNNAGFDVERSFNLGSSWEKIGFVEGRGTSKTAKEYSFSDPLTQVHRNLGTVKYRLRQIDTDGSIEYSQVVDAAIGTAPASVQLRQNYPNPFNPTTTISYQLSKPGHVTLKVFNALGEEIAILVNSSKETGAHTVDYSAEGIPSGTYVYQLNVNGSILQKKMVVMK